MGNDLRFPTWSIAVFFLLLGMTLLASCAKDKKAKTEESSTGDKSQEGQESRDSHAKKGTVTGDLEEIALAYCNFEATKRRGPRNVEEISSFAHDRANFEQALQKKRYVIRWNIGFREMKAWGTSNTIIVYEKEADANGRRMVGTADIKSKGMTNRAFKQALKTQSR